MWIENVLKCISQHLKNATIVLKLINVSNMRNISLPGIFANFFLFLVSIKAEVFAFSACEIWWWIPAHAARKILVVKKRTAFDFSLMVSHPHHSPFVQFIALKNLKIEKSNKVGRKNIEEPNGTGKNKRVDVCECWGAHKGWLACICSHHSAWMCCCYM